MKPVWWLVLVISSLSLTYVEARRLWPTSKELIIREVANGWVVEAHVLNNPYPYREYVFTDPAMAGSAVAGLLNERAPLPNWGK